MVSFVMFGDAVKLSNRCVLIVYTVSNYNTF